MVNDNPHVHSALPVKEELRNTNWATFKTFKTFKTHQKAREFAVKTLDFYNTSINKLANSRPSENEKVVETIK